jgi:hypothetical protein
MGIIDNLVMKRFDPQLRDLELPLTGTYFPAGFRLNIATNSRDVLEAAEESWRLSRHEFEGEPLEFRVVVEPAGELAPQPTFRMQRHLLSIVSDSHNYAIGDPQAWFVAVWISAKTAADHAWLRWFYVESLAYLLLAQRYVVPLHAACVARDGAGILLCGESGAGKSTFSFACARAGWTYLSDDCTWLLAESKDRIAIGRPHQMRFRDDSPRIFPELEGYRTSARPNGKLTIEVPMAAFPQIQTASRCPIGGLVFLDRRGGGRPRCESLPPGEAIDRLLCDLPTYGAEVDAMHERAIRSLQGLPAWCLHYESLEDGIRLLQELFC